MVLERIPARNLYDERRVPGRRAVLAQHARAPLHRARRAVPAREARRALARRSRHQPRPREDGAHGRLAQLLVLGREGVDGRVRDDAAFVVERWRHVGAAGEDAQGRLAHVWGEEVPAPLGLGREIIRADVAAPDDRRTVRHERRGHARRLRVVQEHGVAGAHLGQQRLRVRRERVAVDARRRLVQRRAVARGPVQRVMEALGEAEEVGVPLDHGPARVDALAPRVGQQRAQHLGHAAALGGRVHVPDGAPVEQLAAAGQRGAGAPEGVRLDDPAEAVEGVRAKLDLAERRHSRRSVAHARLTGTPHPTANARCNQPTRNAFEYEASAENMLNLPIFKRR